MNTEESKNLHLRISSAILISQESGDQARNFEASEPWPLVLSLTASVVTPQGFLQEFDDLRNMECSHLRHKIYFRGLVVYKLKSLLPMFSFALPTFTCRESENIAATAWARKLRPILTWPAKSRMAVG